MLPSSLQRAMYGFIESAALFSASQSGMLSLLATSESAVKLSDIAAHASLQAATAGRILNAVCASGIALQTVIDNEPAYALTGESRAFFVPGSAESVSGFIEHLAKHSFPAASNLHQAAMANMPIQSQPPIEIFNALYRDSKGTGDFLQAMWDLGIGPSRELVKDPVLASVEKIVDLGGGPGHFAIAAAEQHPKLQASVFDLPQVAAHFDKFASNSSARDRLRFYKGDFWRDALPEAQLYCLGYVLSDWQSAQCIALLEKIYAALPTDGYVLIAEKLFDPGCYSPYSTVMLDVSMLLETQGCHRTADGYQAMLRQAGFKPARIKRSTGEKHLLIAQK